MFDNNNNNLCSVVKDSGSCVSSVSHTANMLIAGSDFHRPQQQMEVSPSDSLTTGGRENVVHLHVSESHTNTHANTCTDRDIRARTD